jgi:predicted transcriptional regulator
MVLHKLTVELSDEEIEVLEQLAEQDGITPNEALRKAIIAAGYLKQQTKAGRKILVGENLSNGVITGDSNVVGVNFDKL